MLLHVPTRPTGMVTNVNGRRSNCGMNALLPSETMLRSSGQRMPLAKQARVMVGSCDGGVKTAVALSSASANSSEVSPSCTQMMESSSNGSPRSAHTRSSPR